MRYPGSHYAHLPSPGRNSPYGEAELTVDKTTTNSLHQQAF